MSLVEEFYKLQKSTRELYYAEIIDELKKQVARDPFAKQYHTLVNPEAKDFILQCLLDGGFHPTESDVHRLTGERAVRLCVTIPKPLVEECHKLQEFAREQ